MDTELETLAKTRVQARMGFVIHLLMYLAVNAGLFAIWYSTGRGYPWFLWPLIGWGIGIVGHTLTMLFGPGSTFEQHALGREIRRMREAPH
jgi:hypothetical protein